MHRQKKTSYKLWYNTTGQHRNTKMDKYTIPNNLVIITHNIIKHRYTSIQHQGISSTEKKHKSDPNRRRKGRSKNIQNKEKRLSKTQYIEEMIRLPEKIKSQG